MFLAATGAMWAVVVYGARLDSAWLGLDDGLAPLQEFASIFPVTYRPDASAQERPQRQALPPAAEKGGASVLPNAASCPSVGTLLSPPSADKLIGNDSAAVSKDAPAQGPSTKLGTGSPCPPLAAGAERPRTPELPGLPAEPLQKGQDRPRAVQQ
jgi:hypothetical protein